MNVEKEIKVEPGLSDPSLSKKRKSESELINGKDDFDKKSRRRSDRSKHATSYVELDEEFF